MRYSPHLVVPGKDSVHLIIAYKDFGASHNISHIGLGVSATQNAKALHSAGYWTEVWPLKTPADLKQQLKVVRSELLSRCQVPVSHVTISAAWFPVMELAALAREYHDIDFTVVSHSNVGFLQADPNAFTILRGVGDLQVGAVNIHLGSNNEKLRIWWNAVYHQPMRLLPNIYDLSASMPHHRHWHRGQTLRIGAFGAVRPLKNILTAGAAALEIASRLQVDLEFYVSAGRTEGGGGTIMAALSAMYARLRNAELRTVGWEGWPDFRRTVRHMHLLIQVSNTESFNMVTADGVAEGVPSVVSDAIDWVPSRWVAASDNADDIANVGIGVLHDPQSSENGLAALRSHNGKALSLWESMLLGRA